MVLLFMPSVRGGFGLSVAEAMACQPPVVATAANVLTELLHNGQGEFLCSMDDINAPFRTRCYNKLRPSCT